MALSYERRDHSLTSSANAGDRRAAEQRDELPPSHSIASSAVESSVCGTVLPSALAVLRLITSSNLAACTTGRPRTTVLLVQRLDDADVTHRAIAERLERLLVGGACIGGDSLLDAREFRDDDALFLPGLVSGGRRAAREIASAKRRDRRRRKLRISGKLLQIGNRPIDGDPVGFQHRRLRVGMAHRSEYQPVRQRAGGRCSGILSELMSALNHPSSNRRSRTKTVRHGPNC